MSINTKFCTGIGDEYVDIKLFSWFRTVMGKLLWEGAKEKRKKL
jgi:hypothetical protein